MSSTHKPIVMLFDHIGVVVCSLSWQRLQLVLCYINNFYGRVSRFDGQLLVSNIIDTVRFLEEL